MLRALCHQHKLQLSLQSSKHVFYLCGLPFACSAKRQLCIATQKTLTICCQS